MAKFNHIDVRGTKKVPSAFGNVFISSDSISADKTVTFPDGYLNGATPEPNLAFKVVFANGHNAANASSYLSLNGVVVVSNQNGTLAPIPIHAMTEGGSTVYKVLGANTALELYYTEDYDGNSHPAFVVVGNPPVLSSSAYSIYADGQIAGCPAVGSVYVQYPNQKSPEEIWFTATWQNISSDYAGAFFRTEGGLAQDFANQTIAQNDQNKQHNHGGSTGNDSPDHVHYYQHFILSNPDHTYAVGWGDASWHPGYENVASGGASTRHTHSISSDGGTEARPKNYTVRLWKRTA